VSTGGFSPTDGGLAALPHWEARYCVTVFAFLCALPMALYYHLFRSDWRKALGDVELRGLLAATLMSVAVLWAFMPARIGASGVETMGHTIVTAVSAQTTTGFSTLDIAQLSPVAKGALIVSMGIGGSIGSTAGGIKILRLLIVVRLIQLALNRSALASHAVVTTKLGGRPLEDADIIRTLLLIILFGIVILVSWLAFMAYGYDPINALFEVVSATGTVGLSTGITRQGLEPALKAILCADMLLGRLEVIALLVVLYPKTWIGKRVEST
jgi:trk system potassium uptake protein TrkH